MKFYWIEIFRFSSMKSGVKIRGEVLVIVKDEGRFIF